MQESTWTSGQMLKNLPIHKFTWLASYFTFILKMHGHYSINYYFEHVCMNQGVSYSDISKSKMSLLLHETEGKQNM